MDDVLGQRFSTLSEHQNHLDNFLKSQWWVPDSRETDAVIWVQNGVGLAISQVMLMLLVQQPLP